MYPAWMNFIPAIGSVALVVFFAIGYSAYQHISKNIHEKRSHGRHYSDLAMNTH